MPKITKIYSGRAVEREPLLNRSLRRLDGVLNKLASSASIDVIYHGDELARARRYRKIAQQVFSAGYDDALSAGMYRPLFPEIHEGRQFRLYDWDALEPELRDSPVAHEELSGDEEHTTTPDSTGPFVWAVKHDDGRPHWYARNNKTG
jgi:hypothetical protein